MKGKTRLLVLAVSAVLVVGAAWAALWRAWPNVDDAAAVARPPRIRPDYSGTVIPPNIAPLNFAVREQGTRFFVRIRGEAGHAIEIHSGSPKITIPPRRWRALVGANRGRDLVFDVYAEVDRRWQRYLPIVNRGR